MDTTHYPLDTQFKNKTKIKYVIYGKMSEESEDATIKKIYEHPITGYGSINDAF